MKHFIGTALLGAVLATGAMAEGMTHRVAVHVDENDPHVMNMALNNVENLTQYYESQGNTAIVEIVTYGPGINMLISGNSPVKSRISTMSLEMDNLTFSVCQTTLTRMGEKVGEKLVVMDEATIVPSGAVRLIELQENDYAYIRP
jgi:intracellular sulfur oxidation DsrE/DsrF family protein